MRRQPSRRHSALTLSLPDPRICQDVGVFVPLKLGVPFNPLEAHERPLLRKLVRLLHEVDVLDLFARGFLPAPLLPAGRPLIERPDAEV